MTAVPDDATRVGPEEENANITSLTRVAWDARNPYVTNPYAALYRVITRANLVLERVPSATLVVVGFGGYRETLERLLSALAAARWEELLEIARAGRALEGDPGAGAAEGAGDAADTAPPPLRHLLAFLRELDGER